MIYYKNIEKNIYKKFNKNLNLKKIQNRLKKKLNAQLFYIFYHLKLKIGRMYILQVKS